MAFTNLTSLRNTAAKLKLQPIFRHVSIKTKVTSRVSVSPAVRTTHYSSWLFRDQQLFALGCSVQSSGYQARLFHASIVNRDEFQVIKTPPFAESVTEGDVKWQKAVGDFVEEDQVIGEVETDKTSIPIHSPASGVIEALLAEDGSKVVKDQDLVKLKLTKDKGAGKSADKGAAKSPEKPADTKESKPAEEKKEESKPSKSSKDVSGKAPSSPPPSPSVPKSASSSTPSSSVKPKQASSGGDKADKSSSPPSPGSRSEQRVKMSRMRLRIAQRLKEAQNTCAMLTTFNEIDMTNIMEMRTKFKDDFQKKHAIKLGFMSAFVKASAYALQDQPVVNAVIDEQEIVYRDYVDISVAVATPKGLVVPVLRNVEGMNYAHIEKALNELGEKARAGGLAVEDMDGGTFTISNGGVFGSMFGTPIINPPQSAILGMHAIIDRPVVIHGKVEVRPMMYVALTYDHRLIDGREAVTFLRKIKAAVEDPRIMLMDL